MTKRSNLLKFIECYKSYEELWNVNNKNYLNESVKWKGYQALLDILRQETPDANIGLVKNKIASLKNGFKKELKRLKNLKFHREITSNASRPRLWWYNSMKFLENLGKSEKIENSTDPVLTIKNDEIEKNNDKEIETVIPTTESKFEKKDLLLLAYNYLIEDENDIFSSIFQTWACKLRNLPKRKQLETEKKINEIFYEAEMDFMSPQIILNQSSSVSSPISSILPPITCVSPPITSILPSIISVPPPITNVLPPITSVPTPTTHEA